MNSTYLRPRDKVNVTPRLGLFWPMFEQHSVVSSAHRIQGTLLMIFRAVPMFAMGAISSRQASPIYSTYAAVQFKSTRLWISHLTVAHPCDAGLHRGRCVVTTQVESMKRLGYQRCSSIFSRQGRRLKPGYNWCLPTPQMCPSPEKEGRELGELEVDGVRESASTIRERYMKRKRQLWDADNKRGRELCPGCQRPPRVNREFTLPVVLLYKLECGTATRST